MNLISRIDYIEDKYKDALENANENMNALAGIKLYECSDKIFVKSVSDYDPKNPNKPRLTLGSDASSVNAPLTWATIDYAVWCFENHTRPIAEIDQYNGSISVTNKTRKAPIKGFEDSRNYLLLVGWYGYQQLTRDPELLDNFVRYRGILQNSILTNTFNSYRSVDIEVVPVPITIEKSASPDISTSNDYELEVAFLVGGGNNNIAIELNVEKKTEITGIDFNANNINDIINSFKFCGWNTTCDFEVIQREAILAIPYLTKATMTEEQKTDIKYDNKNLILAENLIYQNFVDKLTAEEQEDIFYSSVHANLLGKILILKVNGYSLIFIENQTTKVPKSLVHYVNSIINNTSCSYIKFKKKVYEFF